MVRSMTGFGRAEKTVGIFDITVELRAVNHRYFEFSCRTSRGYSFLEDALKNYVNSRVSRGKIDCFVSVQTTEDMPVEIDINRAYADGYVSALKKLSKMYSVKYNIKTADLARNTEIFIVKRQQINEDEVLEAVKSVASEAVDKFIEMRTVEGERLKGDILSKADTILEKVAFIESHSSETVRAYRERLEEKIKDLLSSTTVDEQRLLTETAIFADKIAVDEETVRLRSHISQLHNFLDSDEAVGRKLDFLVQEMNREANTIGSKSQNVEIAHTVVDIKADIEKIREQIQNIE